jgi:RanBP1 domain-containing protein
MDDKPRPNPFAKIDVKRPSSQTPPQPKVFAAATSKAPAFAGFGSPTTTTTSPANVFSATPKPSSSPAKDASSAQLPANNIFAQSSTPTFGQSSSPQSQESPSKPSSSNNPAKPSFGASSNTSPFSAAPSSTPTTTTTQNSSAFPATAQSAFGAFKASSSASATTPEQPVKISPAKPESLTGYKSPWISDSLFADMMRDDWFHKDKLPKDPHQRAYTVRDLKLARLNEHVRRVITSMWTSPHPGIQTQFVDMRPTMGNYIHVFEAIESELQQAINPKPAQPAATSTSTQLFGANVAQPAPNSGFSASSMNSAFGSTKRKADDDKEDRGKRLKPSAPSPASTPQSNTAQKVASLLDSSNATPAEATKPAQNLFSAAPATPPQNKKDAGSTPFKPMTTFNPSTAPVNDQPKAPASAPFKLFGSNTTVNNTNAAPVPGGFKPTFGAPTSGFKPAGLSNGTNFFAQFGQRAADTEEEKRKRAKEEDFDSDEDDEAEWEKRYEEKQKEKQRQFEESRAKLPPPPKFPPVATNNTATPKFSLFNADSDSNKSTNGDATTLSRSVSPAGSVLDGPKPTGAHLFSHLSGSDTGKDEDEEDAEEETTINGTTTPSKPPTNGGRSLFDRISKDGDEAVPAPSDNPGDHTWKPSTPLKFGPAGTSSGTFKFPTPATNNKFGSGPTTGGIFGSKTPSVTISSPSAPNTPAFSTPATGFGKAAESLAPPSVNSSAIPSVNTSRASTPQLSELSDSGSAADEGPEDAGPQSDLVNFEAAIEGHEVFFKAAKAKALKYDKAADTGKNWVTQGIGPIAVIKNQETGVVSILMKAHPSGKVVINTRLVGSIEYKPMAKRVRFFVPREGGQMDSMLVQFASEEEAQGFAECCESNKKR